VTAGQLLMRAAGVGPVRSLVAAGVIDPQQRVILADFKNVTDDSLLAVVVTDAFRTNLARSSLVSVADPVWVARVLEQTGEGPGAPHDVAHAREVAVREGLCCVIAGEVGALGGTYLVSVRIIVAESGEVLAAVRETAEDTEAIVGAIDKISKRFR
jgi:TolB-like protein